MPENLIPGPEVITQWLAEHPNWVLLVRTCKINDDGQLTSQRNFEWPNTLFAEAYAPDWNNVPECGNGLHALLPGQQIPGIWYNEGAWLLVAAERNSLINLYNEKCKAPGFTILAIAYTNGNVLIPQLLKQLGVSEPVYKAAIADLNNNSIVNVGDEGFAVTAYSGKAQAGYYGIAIATYLGEATTRDNGTSFTLNAGISVSGHSGRSITGYSGRAIAGEFGVAIGREGSYVAAGFKGIIQSERWLNGSLRVGVGYIGETLDSEGAVLQPNQYYKLGKQNQTLCWFKEPMS